jgi:DNA polymerase III delta subunit
MGKKFAKELAHSFPAIASIVKEVLPADSMTDNEIKAWVKAYFKFSVED